MMSIGVAVAAAGIIVGLVNLGVGGLITELVGIIAGDSLVVLLILTAIASLILGMGLPTANYIVMATLTATLIVELAPPGIEIPSLLPTSLSSTSVFSPMIHHPLGLLPTRPVRFPGPIPLNPASRGSPMTCGRLFYPLCLSIIQRFC